MRLGSAMASIKLDQGRGTKDAAKRPDKLCRRHIGPCESEFVAELFELRLVPALIPADNGICGSFSYLGLKQFAKIIRR